MQNGRWKRYQTSNAARTEIVAFDRGGKFYPGDYLLLPPPIRNLPKGPKKPSGVTRRAPRWKRQKPHKTEGVRDPAYKSDGE